MKIPAAPSDNKYRILIVEDDASINKLVEVQLRLAGFAPHVAVDGLDGWEIFQSSDPHLVLSDIAMPGIDGHELTSRIRAVSGVPIVLMTASGSDDFEMKGFKNGADDYVTKPFNPKILLARVVAHLRRVYRYDEAGAPAPTAPTTASSAMASLVGTAQSPSARAVPNGWTKCDSCDYMGPEQRFEGTDLQGAPIIVCPNCKNRAVTFTVS